MAMDEVQAATRRDAVYGWLARVEGLTFAADERSLAALASTELRRMCEMVREVLATHDGNEDGRCAQCSGWFRPVAFPCAVWEIAHKVLIAAEVTVGGDGGGHGHRPRHAW